MASGRLKLAYQYAPGPITKAEIVKLPPLRLYLEERDTFYPGESAK